MCAVGETPRPGTGRPSGGRSTVLVTGWVSGPPLDGARPRLTHLETKGVKLDSLQLRPRDRCFPVAGTLVTHAPRLPLRAPWLSRATGGWGSPLGRVLQGLCPGHPGLSLQQLQAGGEWQMMASWACGLWSLHSSGYDFRTEIGPKGSRCWSPPFVEAHGTLLEPARDVRPTSSWVCILQGARGHRLLAGLPRV